MIPHLDAPPLQHGGDLAMARRLFPGAPQPFIDLSTGINPFPYPLPPIPAGVFARLPDAEAQTRLAGIAARTYGAPSAAHVTPAPGTQILLALVAALAPAGQAAILGPTYSEHARAAALAGHQVTETADIEQLHRADLAVITNPNNPDGRVIAKDRLLALAQDLKNRGGLLVMDEAFMDVCPPEASLAGEIDRGNIVVLRSFGKFFGLAGLRLGFALAAPHLAATLNARLGPWAVSGPALAIGERALADSAWMDATRNRLADAAQKLNRLLAEANIEVVGGTSLFRLAQVNTAAETFRRLGHAGIVVRAFREQPTWLRFGLPGDQDWSCLRSRLGTVRSEPP
jgi:cobalamin biosynthesis protein CobC